MIFAHKYRIVIDIIHVMELKDIKKEPKYLKHFLAEDTIDEKDIEALCKWLQTTPRLTMGSLTAEFEDRCGAYWGRRHAVFCNSGSSANFLMYAALDASGIIKNKKVIVPSAGWPTTVAPAMQLGFEPIMCEADPETFGLDLNHLESLLKEHNPATVIMVQVLGIPNKMDEILALKEKYGFILLEDACAAMGASYKGKPVGSFGDMSSFSFYFGHQISTIEGGLVLTNNKELSDTLLMLRSHGWDKDLDETARSNKRSKYPDKVSDYHAHFFFQIPGYNLRNTDLGAFLGLRQLAKMDWLIGRRNENHLLYQKLLGPKFSFQKAPENSIICSIHFAMLAKDNNAQHEIYKTLLANKIETRIFAAGNLGRHPFWFERYGEFHAPMADRLYDTGIFLPNHPSLAKESIEFISKVALEA